jgi:DNA-binding IclR family transcriptional regulator
MTTPNPFRMPNAPRVTIRHILPWIASRPSPVSTADLVGRFGMKQNDAGMRVMRLHRYGYLSRRRRADGSWEYTPTAFGLAAAKRWRT